MNKKLLYLENALIASKYEQQFQFCNAAVYWKRAVEFASGVNIKWSEDRFQMCTHISENSTPLALAIKRKAINAVNDNVIQKGIKVPTRKMY